MACHPRLITIKFHYIIQREAEDLAHMIVLENGKNYTEAMAEGRPLHIFLVIIERNSAPAENNTSYSFCLLYFTIMHGSGQS